MEKCIEQLATAMAAGIKAHHGTSVGSGPECETQELADTFSDLAFNLHKATDTRIPCNAGEQEKLDQVGMLEMLCDALLNA